MTRALWIVQGLLALIFLFAGGAKFVMPVAEMTKQMPGLSGTFLHFIGVCEVLGAIGLILPGLLHIQEWLTPLAAVCLVIIMIGAVVVSVMAMGVAGAIAPLVVGLLAAFVAYWRWRRAPQGVTVRA
jgi:hypothetical protein